MKQILEDATQSVQSARRTYDDINNTIWGAIAILEHQNILTEEAQGFLQAQLNRLETQSKKIEIEYYKLHNLLADNK